MVMMQSHGFSSQWKDIDGIVLLFRAHKREETVMFESLSIGEEVLSSHTSQHREKQQCK